MLRHGPRGRPRSGPRPTETDLAEAAAGCAAEGFHVRQESPGLLEAAGRRQVVREVVPDAEAAAAVPFRVHEPLGFVRPGSPARANAAWRWMIFPSCRTTCPAGRTAFPEVSTCFPVGPATGISGWRIYPWIWTGFPSCLAAGPGFRMTFPEVSAIFPSGPEAWIVGKVARHRGNLAGEPGPAAGTEERIDRQPGIVAGPGPAGDEIYGRRR